MTLHKATYTLRKHPSYGFQQITPTPNDAERAEFYAQEFYSNYAGFNDSSQESRVSDREFLDAQREDMCETIQEITGAKSFAGMTWLDVGCGWGDALRFFKSKGFDCYGIEPVKDAVETSMRMGLNVREGGLEDFSNFEGPRYDVVSLFNVLEHLGDPVNAVQQIRKKLLKPNGVLIVEVPNEFNAFQVAGNDLFNLNQWWVCPPNHLNYFSSDTLSNLLMGEGFSVHTIESSFPLEMFLLFGDVYVGNNELGKSCHAKRVNFELNLLKAGKRSVMRKLYRSLAQLNLGRQVTAYAIPI